MPGAETAVVESWIAAKLAASTPLVALVSTRIYLDSAPKDAAYPFVVYGLQDANDVTTGVGVTRIVTSTLYTVRAIAQVASFGGPGTTLATLATHIDAALTSVSVDTTTQPAGSVFGALREQPFRMVEADQGKEYRHLGGIYRIIAQAA